MSLDIIDLPEAPDRSMEQSGNEFDRAVKERLTSSHPVKLPVFTVQYLEGLTARSFKGYIVRCSNGDAGDECLAYCTGQNWKVIQLADKISMT